MQISSSPVKSCDCVQVPLHTIDLSFSLKYRNAHFQVSSTTLVSPLTSTELV